MNISCLFDKDLYSNNLKQNFNYLIIIIIIHFKSFISLQSMTVIKNLQYKHKIKFINFLSLKVLLKKFLREYQLL